MAASDHIRIEQFLDDLEQHADSGGVVRGTPAKKAMRAMNIRHIGRATAPGDLYGATYDYSHITEDGQVVNRDNVRPNERLYTNQQHLHVPTLRKYAQNPLSWENAPAEDRHTVSPYLPEYDDEYRPYVYEDGADGRNWIEEGHHRIMAARLNGMDLKVNRGDKL